MKKISAILLAAIMALSMCACGRRDNKQPTETPTTIAPTTAPATTTPSATPSTTMPSVMPDMPDMEPNIPDPSEDGISMKAVLSH